MKRGASKSEKPKWDGGGDGKKEVFSPLARSEILDGGGGLVVRAQEGATVI